MKTFWVKMGSFYKANFIKSIKVFGKYIDIGDLNWLTAI